MIIFDDLKKIKDIEPTAVALGNFDGLHLGHTELIGHTVASAHSSGLKSAIFTFSNNPQNVITGRTTVKNIISLEEKLSLIESLGLDYLFSVPFDDYFHEMNPSAFADDLLAAKFNARQVFCGFNFHFGHNAEGDSKTLSELQEREGFTVNVLEPYIVNGNIVSSTLIRQLISEGHTEETVPYLGRRYAISGRVVPGNRIGSKIGFPTCNLSLEESQIQPSNGVYATLSVLDGEVYKGVSNIGVRPTVGDNEKSLETHIFGLSGDQYGKFERVEFLKKLRDEQKFNSIEELKTQIEKDKENALAYFESYAGDVVK